MKLFSKKKNGMIIKAIVKIVYIITSFHFFSLKSNKAKTHGNILKTLAIERDNRANTLRSLFLLL